MSKRGTAGNHRRPLVVLVVLAAVIIGSFVVVRALRTKGATPRRDVPADIILITIDTLRADALGFAGNKNVETPFLDRLASEGVIFTNAHAHNVVTLPSHANILTGLYPYQHGIRDNAGFMLDPKFKSIATMLRERGYATGAFVGAFPLDARYGLNQGFDVYDDKYREGSKPLSFEVAERPANEVLEAASSWFRSVAGKKRFMWIHLYDPHAPYLPPAEFAAKYSSAPYYGEVAATDAALSRYLAPLLEETPSVVLIMTADHGEALGDHGELTHGLFAYESTLKVPLLLYDKARVEPAKDSRYVGHIDIMPTILDRVAAKIPADLPGRSLYSMDEPRDIYFEALSTSLNRGWAPLVGMIHGDRKYIELPIPELYDLTSDPAESKNVYPEERRSVFEIRTLLADASPSAAAGERKISPEEGAKLLSLGYVSGAAAKKNYTEADDPKNLIDIDSNIHKTIELYQLGEVGRALHIAREVVAARPGMAIGQELLAFMLQQSDRRDEAVTTLRQAVARGDASDSMKKRLGLMLSEGGRAEEAVALLAPFAATNDVEMLNAYGIALADTGRVQDAVQHFNRILVVDPNNATALQNLGIVALRAGDRDRARGYLMQALALNDRMPLALNTLGVIYAQEGKHDEAIAAWSKAVANDAKLFDALYNLGLVARQIGRVEIARSALARFVETAPHDRYGRDIARARQILAAMNRNPVARR